MTADAERRSRAGRFALILGLGALKLYGKLGNGSGPPWLGVAHRTSGTLGFLLAIPVAYHCLWALGFDPSEPRTLIHSLAGCFVFGAFAAKMLTVRSHRRPGWALPTIGGLLFTGLTVV